MRGRDVRAIIFCVAVIAVVFGVSMALFHSWIGALALAAAAAAWVLTRPRMIRVFRRMTGRKVEQIDYFRND